MRTTEFVRLRSGWYVEHRYYHRMHALSDKQVRTNHSLAGVKFRETYPCRYSISSDSAAIFFAGVPAFPITQLSSFTICMSSYSILVQNTIQSLDIKDDLEVDLDEVGLDTRICNLKSTIGKSKSLPCDRKRHRNVKKQSKKSLS